MVTFAVDEVTPAADRLPTRPRGELHPDALVTGGDPAEPLLEPDGVHPLLGAVARAFADHRPLVLTPDAVWLTIAQGVAQHVKLHAEELRPRLVSHTGRRRLAVEVDALPHDAAGWAHLSEAFGKLLAAEAAGTDLFDCDFSTSTGTDRVAARIVMLDAYSPYFALWAVCVCGIPSITLTGTVEDWRRIRSRVQAIESFGLERWTRSLEPIADQFVRAASGDVDTAFWTRIYNPVDAYGGDVVTGWAARFYPYLKGAAVDVPNRLLDLPIDEPRDVTTAELRWYDGPGIGTDSVPALLSRVVVNVADPVGGHRAVALHGGLVGVAQDPDGALRPVSGWHLTPAEVDIEEVVDRIVADHVTTPPSELDDDIGATAEVVALYTRIGSAELFGGTLRIVPFAERRSVWLQGAMLVGHVALADGRTLAAVYDTNDVHWALCRISEPDPPGPGDDPDLLRYRDGRLLDDPADVPVYGTSLTLLLQAALDAEGPDFDVLETGRLADLLEPLR